MLRYVPLLLLPVCLGCGSSKPKEKEIVAIADVAPDLVEVAKKTLPNVKFDSAYKITVNGEEVFELRGKQPNGKIREVEVSVSGKVIEVE